MPDDSVYHLNLVIDDLTNSIRQLNSGESLETELLLATKEDMKIAIKKTSGILHGRPSLTSKTA